MLLSTMSDKVKNMEDIQTNLNAIVTEHEEKKEWEYVAGFNAAVAILMPEIQLRDVTVKSIAEENHKLWSIVFVRYQIEDLEEMIDQIFVCPSKDMMLNSSKCHSEWICTVENPNYRYIKFFYFLTSTNPLAIEMKGILDTERVSLHDFCRLVVKIFQRASYRIHRPVINLTITQIKNGLRLYGLDQQELLECVDVLQRIHNRSVRRKQTWTSGQSLHSSEVSSLMSSYSQSQEFGHHYSPPPQQLPARSSQYPGYSSQRSFHPPSQSDYLQSGGRKRRFLPYRGRY